MALQLNIYEFSYPSVPHMLTTKKSLDALGALLTALEGKIVADIKTMAQQFESSDDAEQTTALDALQKIARYTSELPDSQPFEPKRKLAKYLRLFAHVLTRIKATKRKCRNCC